MEALFDGVLRPTHFEKRPLSQQVARPKPMGAESGHYLERRRDLQLVKPPKCYASWHEELAEWREA